MANASSGLHDRLKKTAAISQLGRGFDVGPLNDYAHEIALYLLLKVFRREINNNQNRSKRDLIEMTANIIKEMKLESSLEQVERLVDGVLYSGDPRRQANFSVMLYDEKLKAHREYKFRYLIPDREASNWSKGGSTVYRLTETAQEIIFITREVLEEFGFDLEQFYTLQLIKNGNFSEAKDSVNNLIARVRNLIKKEKDWREDILRNPGLIFSSQEKRKKMSEGELREQFVEEKKVFSDMFSWQDRLDNFPTDKKKEGELLFEELERARALHDRLAELAISNLSLEMEIRTENPDVFWKTSRVSFKKDIWQNQIVKKGLPEMDLLTDLLRPLFSPAQDFIFPLDWAWEEQQLYTYNREIEEESEEWPKEEIKPEREEIDWEQILDLWEPVFLELKDKGYFPLSRLNEIPEEEKNRWLAQEKNLELFMMFIITEIKLRDFAGEHPGLDERLLLFNRLLKRNHQLRDLSGKIIKAEINSERERVDLRGEFQVSPYVLKIEEVE
ncbi:MAG: hypothetical protein ACOC21_03570 [Halanaerobiales bacterium]